MQRYQEVNGKSLRVLQVPFWAPQNCNKPVATEHFEISESPESQSALALTVFHRFGAPQKELFTQTGFFLSKARGVAKGAKEMKMRLQFPPQIERGKNYAKARSAKNGRP